MTKHTQPSEQAAKLMDMIDCTYFRSEKIQLLATALEKEHERVRRETQLNTARQVIEVFRKELIGLLDTMSKELADERALASQGAPMATGTDSSGHEANDTDTKGNNVPGGRE